MVVQRKWRIYIGGTEKHYTSIDFEKTHPSPYPDAFTIVLPEKNETISSFDVVEIKKNGITIFYGYVEKREWVSEKDTIVSGRCRKLIVWKKWTERFEEAREGMEGFFGYCLPEEVFKFLLRCPISDVPPEDEEWRDYPVCKIGWGLNPQDWACSSNNSSEGSDPKYVKLRMGEFYWRNRGGDNFVQILIPNGDDGSAMGWSENPANCAGCGGTHKDCVDISGDACQIYTSSSDVTTTGYHFENLTAKDADASGVSRARIGVRMRCEWSFVWGATVMIKVEVYDTAEAEWKICGYLRYFCKGFGNGPYWTAYLDATDVLDNVSQVDGARIRLTKMAGTAGITARVDYISLVITYSNKGSQEVGDYFLIDLGESHDRVSGIIIQSRHEDDAYARNFKIECATTKEVELGETNEGDTAFSAAVGSVQIAGPWTVPAGGMSVNGIWVYIDSTWNDTLKAVIYRKTDGVAGWTLQGTGTSVTINTNELHWQWLPFAAPVSLTAGWQVYLGFCLAAGDSVRWYYDTSATLKNRYARWGQDCTPPDPFGAADDSDVGTKRWSIYAVQSDWTSVAGIASNTCRDIVQSWKPRQAQFIKITITIADTSHSWQISQIFVYESDLYKYCVVEEI